MFARAVDSDATIQNALKDVVFLPVDCENGEGPEIAKKYGVRAYPTFLMTNARGEVTDGWIGYPGPEKWAAFAAAGVRDQRTVVEKQAAYAQAPTGDLAWALANHAASSFDFVTSVKYFRAARDFDPANAATYTGEILTNMYYGSDSGAFTLDEVEAEAKLVFAAPDATAESKVDVAGMISSLARGADQPERAVPFILAALAASEGNEDLARSRAPLEIDRALLVDRDTDKAVALKKASLPEGWQDDARRLNGFAWWCFENRVNLAEAEELALRGVELADSDKQRADILDTAAELCALRGDSGEAVARIKRAIELDPDKEYLKEQLARFEKELAEKKG